MNKVFAETLKINTNVQVFKVYYLLYIYKYLIAYWRL